MKKRAMKKWIPKNTFYCYKYDKHGKIHYCKWHWLIENKPYQENGFCTYLGSGDWQHGPISLLFDACKECGVSVWNPKGEY